MPKDVLIRVPNSLVEPWQQIRQMIEARISERQRIPMERVSTASLFEEVIQILGEYIFVAGYPRPGDVHKRTMVANAQHQELVAAVAKVQELEAELERERERRPTLDELAEKIGALEAQLKAD